jgi:phosphoribosyl 1,2-cyclic phosphodiesterase
VSGVRGVREIENACDETAIFTLIRAVKKATLSQMVHGFFASRKGTGRSSERRPPPRPAEAGEIFRPALDAQSRYFTLWGTRGSMPTPGAAFLRHGGQTSCMAVTSGETVCIFDAGSGIRDLGLELVKSKIRTLHLFITHTHWDHIQGFPFFTPAYDPSFTVNVYAVRGFGKDLKSVFSGQLDKDYFPVQMENMRGKLNFVHLGSEPVRLPGAKVTWEFANHPGATVGYKIDLGDRKIAWVPDNEFLEGYTGAPDLISSGHEHVAPYRKMIEFLSGVDLLIHEAQYTNEEYPAKTGWGHSCLSNACLLAKLAKVRRWIVTHHDPAHDDRFLESKINLTRQLLARIGHPVPVAHGYDGMTEF